MAILSFALGTTATPLEADSESEGLFSESSVPGTLEITDRPTTKRYRYVDVDFGAFIDLDGTPKDIEPGHLLRLNLFDDVVQTAILERVEFKPGSDYTWLGRLQGDPWGQVILVVGDGDHAGVSDGDCGGIVDCGETIELEVSLTNEGYAEVTGIVSELAVADPAVIWTGNMASSYPSIEGLSSDLNTDAFEFQVADDAANGHIIHFDMAIEAENWGPGSVGLDVEVYCGASFQYQLYLPLIMR
jgi:hypothetical protein